MRGARRVLSTSVGLVLVVVVALLVSGCGHFAPTLPTGEGGFDAPLPAVVFDIFGSALDEDGGSHGPTRVETTDGQRSWVASVDRGGGYRLEDVTVGARALSFAHEGYATIWRMVEIVDENVNLDVVLQQPQFEPTTACPIITMNRLGVDHELAAVTVSGMVENMDGEKIALLHNGQAILVDVTAVYPTGKTPPSGGGYTGEFSKTVALFESQNDFQVVAANAVCTVQSETLSVGLGIGGPNLPPVIDALTTNTIGVGQRGVANLHCEAHDDEGDTLSYQWTATGGWIGSTSPDATWGGDPDPGWSTITCKVTDGHGGEATATILLRTLGGPNVAPVIDSLTADPTQAGQRGVSEITCVAHDDDGDPLFYSWTATGGIIGGGDPTTIWITEPTPGFYTITVTVTDGADTVTADVQVEVI